LEGGPVVKEQLALIAATTKDPETATALPKIAGSKLIERAMAKEMEPKPKKKGKQRG
jgi:hypothetical protein